MKVCSVEEMKDYCVEMNDDNRKSNRISKFEVGSKQFPINEDSLKNSEKNRKTNGLTKHQAW